MARFCKSRGNVESVGKECRNVMKCIETVSLLREQEKRCYRVSLCNRTEGRAMWQCGSVAQISIAHNSDKECVLLLQSVLGLEGD